MRIINMRTSIVIMDCSELNPKPRDAEDYMKNFEMQIANDKIRLSAVDLDMFYFFCKSYIEAK